MKKQLQGISLILVSILLTMVIGNRSVLDLDFDFFTFGYCGLCYDVFTR